MHREEQGYNIKNCFEAAMLSFSLTCSVDHQNEIITYQDPPSLCHNNSSHKDTDTQLSPDPRDNTTADPSSTFPVNDPQFPLLDSLFNEDFLATCKSN